MSEETRLFLETMLGVYQYDPKLVAPEIKEQLIAAGMLSEKEVERRAGTDAPDLNYFYTGKPTL